ncbi:helix-turn-helix domain-containing protein [Telluria mixta]|uniref:helix-turn-helix domain-containing protein n=1 Tax=Telluria mixta TaxID=34071 RepID=UPI003530B4CC
MRKHRASTGVTPSRYFVNLRIDEAKRMQHDWRHGVIDVAFAVGYRSPSHFSQVFRTLTGLSPSAYRNRQ